MSEFFLELFSEEIPANLQITARENLLKEFKILFENISGDFTRHYIVSPIYKPGKFYELQKINDLAKKLGISVKDMKTLKHIFQFQIGLSLTKNTILIKMIFSKYGLTKNF